MTRRRAFSLIELVIVVVILGIIGAIAVPRMSRGASAAREGSLVTDLARMRAAIQLYHTEHNDTYPTGADIADQLTKKTDVDGNIEGGTGGPFIYGPYLREIPTLKAGSKAGQGLTAIGTTTATTNAWLYAPADDGAIFADLPDTDTDAAGVQFNTY